MLNDVNDKTFVNVEKGWGNVSSSAQSTDETISARGESEGRRASERLKEVWVHE